MFTYVDMDFLNTRYSPSFDVQQSRILDSQAQCNATIMERLRYETQCKQTCCVPSYEFNDAVRNVYENMQAFYADNVQIETMSKAITACLLVDPSIEPLLTNAANEVLKIRNG